MSLIDTLRALAITVRNEKKKEANSAVRIGDLFLAIIDFIKGLASGQIRQEGVDTYNDTSGGKTSLLNKYPIPQIGWTILVRNDETNGGKASLYQWNGSRWINLETVVYNDDVATQKDLSEIMSQRNNQFDYDVLLSKFEVHEIPIVNWKWADASKVAGVIPELFNLPIWSTSTDSWITIPFVPNLNHKFIGIIYECRILKNLDNLRNINVYFQVNGAYKNVSILKNISSGNRQAMIAYYDLSTLTEEDTINLLLSIHASDRNDSTKLPVVAEFSSVRVFYIDDTKVDGVFTLTDYVNQLDSQNNNKFHSIYSTNNYFDSIAESNRFLAGNGGQSSSVGYVGYLSGYVAVAAGEQIFYTIDFPYSHIPEWGCLWGYSDEKGSDPIMLVKAGTHIDEELTISQDGSVKFIRFCHKKGGVIPKITGTANVAQVTKMLQENPILDEIENGKKIVYGDVSDFTGGTIIERNVEEDYLVYKKTGKGNSWAVSPIFIPKGSNLVYLKMKIEFTKVNTTTGLRIHIANGITVAGKFPIVKEILQDGEYIIPIDPAYYTVYEGYTQFCFWINNQSMSADDSSITAKISGLQIYEFDNSVQATNISGSNAKELFESTDKELTDIKASITKSDSVQLSPLGNKFELSVQDDRSVIAVPIIPDKAAFFGNSLIAGYGYGMAASANDKDYYYLITEYIKKLNPSFTSSRLRSGGFEGLTDPALIDSTIQNDVISQLTGDEDLVSIQLGDNVNSPEKNAVFPESSLKLCQAIRKKCPKARVVWMGMWYPSTQRYQNIQDACKATGCKFISYAHILTKPNVRNSVGNLTQRGLATRTLSDVIFVTENSATNITVKFAVGGVSYDSKPLDVESYSLSGSTLTYKSEYQIINHAGEASHPADEGFRWIANDFLYIMEMTDNIEEY